jgi:hypothetical protein
VITPRLRLLFGSIALASGAWGLLVVAGCGQSLSIGSWRISWTIWREFRVPETGRLARLAAFAAGFLPGCVAAAFVNWWLYGSPAASGYGNLGNLFDAANIGPNLRRYTTWLADTQTPLALVGIAALVVPSRRLWITPASRAAARLLALVIAASS